MTRRLFASLIICFLVLLLANPGRALCPQSDSSSGDALTLEQAIALALQSNRQVKIKGLEVDKAEDQLSAGRTSRLPTFSLYTLVACIKEIAMGQNVTKLWHKWLWALEHH